jgi:hypothetical protein
MTTKQNALVEVLVADSSQPPEKRKSKKDLLKAAGYSANTGIKPSQVFNAPTFRQAMVDAGITDDLLSNVLKEGLQATKAVIMGKESNESFVDIQPDHIARHKYLETAIKVNGYTLKEELPVGDTYNTQINIGDQTPRGNKMVEDFTDYMKQATLPKAGDTNAKDTTT